MVTQTKRVADPAVMLATRAHCYCRRLWHAYAASADCAWTYDAAEADAEDVLGKFAVAFARRCHDVGGVVVGGGAGGDYAVVTAAAEDRDVDSDDDGAAGGDDEDCATNDARDVDCCPSAESADAADSRAYLHRMPHGKYAKYLH